MKRFKTKSNRLTNESLVILAMRVVETVNTSAADSVKNGKYFTQLVSAIDKYMDTIGTGSEQQYSKDIDALFEKRRQMFEEIYKYLNGLVNSPDAEMSKAAEMLFDVVNRFGANFSRLKISDQSLRYMRIFETLKKSDYTSSLVKTLLADKLSAIDAVQIEYENLYLDRGNSQSVSIATTVLRREIEIELKQFYDELNWTIKINSTDELLVLRRNIEKRLEEIYITRRVDKKTEENVPQVA